MSTSMTKEKVEKLKKSWQSVRRLNSNLDQAQTLTQVSISAEDSRPTPTPTRTPPPTPPPTSTSTSRLTQTQTLPSTSASFSTLYRWAWADASGPLRHEWRQDRPEAMATAFVDALPEAWAKGEDLFVVPEQWTECGYGVIVSDMDSTLIVGESLDELADSLGVGAEVADITARSMRGELDFSQALDQRFQLIKGVHRDQFIELGETTALSGGAVDCMASMVASGIHCTLATGGFDIIASILVERLGMHDFVANQLLFDAEGQFMGKLAAPVLDANTKLLTYNARRQTFGQGKPCIAMGDGANDVAMLCGAEVGIAYHAKPIVRDATVYQLNYAGLNALPWLLGI